MAKRNKSLKIKNVDEVLTIIICLYSW